VKRGKGTSDKAPNKKASRRGPKKETAFPSLSKRTGIRHLLPIAALIVITLVVYSNSLHAPFLLDNEDVILKDNRVHVVTPQVGEIRRVAIEDLGCAPALLD
jgi:hypothetical protein